jgi:hypothetical protein
MNPPTLTGAEDDKLCKTVKEPIYEHDIYLMVSKP